MTNRDSPVPRASVGEVFVMTFIMAAVSGLGAVRKCALAAWRRCHGSVT